MAKDQYWVIFARDVAGVPVTVKRKRFNPNDAAEGISFRGATHIIDLGRPAYRLNRRYYYIVDMEKGQRVLFQSENPVSPKLMDSIMRREIIKQLVAGLGMTDMKLAIILMLVGLGAGVMAGIVIGQFIDFGGATAAPPVEP
jgi:hypothetical protein